MRSFTLKGLLSHVKGQLLQEGANKQIEYILTDSRTLTFAPSTCFFCIVTNRNNGHRYIAELYKKGVRNFVVSQDVLLADYPEAAFLSVKNSIDALQEFAAYKRTFFKGKLIAITGSNGKTVVKEWLHQILQQSLWVTRSPKSFNSQIGVALSLWNMDELADVALIEAGISEPGEMDKLVEIIKPDWVLITNLGVAHQQNFQSLTQKAAEKIKLARTAHNIFYCKDYLPLKTEIERSFKSEKLFSWSAKGDALHSVLVETQEYASVITIAEKGIKNEFAIPFTDHASVENAVNVWFVARALGLDEAVLKNRMAHLEPIEMRLEMKDGLNGCKIINDSYNNDIHSLSIALDFLAQQSNMQNMGRTLVLSDIQQASQNKDELYKEVQQLVENKKVTRFVGVGEESSIYLKNLNINAEFYANTEAFLSVLHNVEFSNEVILLKGARSFQFERISHALEVRMHKTIMEINLTALLHNFHYYKSLLKPDTRIMAMVKAFAYGSGSYEVARLLQYHGCDYFAVAVADEGVELRNVGISLPILVLAPERESFEKMIAHKLEPEIYGMNELRDFMSCVQRLGIQHYPVHIKLDTGMHRLGFMPHQIAQLAEVLAHQNQVKVQSVFTHLAGADEEALDDFTLQQLYLFEQYAELLEVALQYKTLKHVLNSAGIERFTAYENNMVRLGIGLYGVGVLYPEKTRQVATLKTGITQIRDVKANESVGYNRKGRVVKDSRIATIPIGYADGLDRRLSNGVGEVMVNGKLAPIIGNICMDLTMIDVTNVDAKEGDEVVLFGDDILITTVAKKMGTIPYEVLTNISRRVKRVYVSE